MLMYRRWFWSSQIGGFGEEGGGLTLVFWKLRNKRVALEDRVAWKQGKVERAKQRKKKRRRKKKKKKKKKKKINYLLYFEVIMHFAFMTPCS